MITRTRSWPANHPFKTLLICVLVAAVTITALELTNTTHWFHHRTFVTASAATKGIPASSTKSATSKKDSKQRTAPAGSAANAPQTTSAAPDTRLFAPTGPFVSNHRPNLSGQPAPNTINSVCNTTSGAMCQIIFTKDNVTKSLPAQLTDEGGATYWNGWKLQDVGLTAGTWHITAKATLGSQTETSTDALNMVVAE